MKYRIKEVVHRGGKKKYYPQSFGGEKWTNIQDRDGSDYKCSHYRKALELIQFHIDDEIIETIYHEIK